MTDLYGRRWKKARADYLAAHPLCVFCEAQGRPVLAEVVDHVLPHKGDLGRFWNESNWQSLCGHCHDSVKASIERGGKVPVGVDGWPVGETG